MSQAALVVIFNNRFERNVPRLEEYYAPRFSQRSYLMPFATSEDPHVIRVVENGWCFSGHVAQGVSRFKNKDVTHYVFAGDDLILNPGLNESTLVESLGLRPGAGYIKSLSSADSMRFSWPWAIRASNSLLWARVDYSKELPAADEASAKFKAMGLELRPPYPRGRRDWRWLRIPNWHWHPRRLHWNLKQIKPWLADVSSVIGSLGKPSRYPLLAGYSDFFVVPAECIDAFAHFCGVFAAINMFAEVAVPTALALACSSVQTELALNEDFSNPHARPAAHAPMRGMEFWEAEIQTFCKKLGFSWTTLMEQFPEDVLYYHPVKLSQWK